MIEYTDEQHDSLIRGHRKQLADAQATVEALQKKYDDLLGKYRQLVDFYDKHNGTPCEQIKHQQQVEALQRERDTARRRVDELEAREVDVVLLRGDLDDERDKVKGQTQRAEYAEGKVRELLLKQDALELKLLQLQALVRAFFSARAVGDVEAYTKVFVELKRALDATTPSGRGTT